MEVVVEGRLEGSCTLGHHVLMVGDKLITKCASKYSATEGTDGNGPGTRYSGSAE